MRYRVAGDELRPGATAATIVDGHPMAKKGETGRALGAALMSSLVGAVFGGFAEKNAFEDMLVVLAFGVVGWVMVRIDWQRPPLLLGLVLGPLMENRLFPATDNYGWGWVGRPGVLILFALTFVGIFYPALKKRWGKEEKKAEIPAAETVEEVERGAIKNWDAVFCAFLILALGLALWQSRNFGYRAGLFPWTIGFPVLALAVAQLALILTGRTSRTVGSDGGAGSELPRDLVVSRTKSIVGWIIGVMIAIWLLGFSLAVPVTTLLYLRFTGREKWPITIVFAAVSWAFFFGLFEYAVNIPFPRGQLFEWFSP